MTFYIFRFHAIRTLQNVHPVSPLFAQLLASASILAISCLVQFSRPPLAMIFCKLSANSPIFSSHFSPLGPSRTSMTLRLISYVKIQPVLRVRILSLKVTRRRSMKRGLFNPRRALMLFREKIFPRLPATTGGRRSCDAPELNCVVL